MSRDELRGVSPLSGVPDGAVPEPEPGGEARSPGKGPARNYSWKNFEANNLSAVRHGAFGKQLIAPEVQELVDEVLADERMPDHLKAAPFRWALQAWAESEVVAHRLFAWCEELGPAAMRPPMPGTRPPVESWRAASAHASRLRARLGLDPLSYAALAKDLGLAGRAAEDNLRQLSAAGAEIVARRRELTSGGES